MPIPLWILLAYAPSIALFVTAVVMATGRVQRELYSWETPAMFTLAVVYTVVIGFFHWRKAK